MLLVLHLKHLFIAHFLKYFFWTLSHILSPCPALIAAHVGKAAQHTIAQQLLAFPSQVMGESGPGKALDGRLLGILKIASD